MESEYESALEETLCWFGKLEGINPPCGQKYVNEMFFKKPLMRGANMSHFKVIIIMFFQQIMKKKNNNNR